MTRQQRLVLIASILASFVAFLDSAVVNVALPAIKLELGGGLAAQQWIVDAYLVTLGSLILIAGSLSDLFGRKKVLFGGLIGFAVSSLLCTIAPSVGFLIAGRALQGMAGALLVPSSLALIISTFSGPAQSKAIGTWTAWTGISFILGPLLGGFLVDSVSWRLIFAINILPIAVTVWLLSLITTPDKRRKDVSIDVKGAVLCALGLGGAVFGLIEQPNYGWSHPLIYLSVLIGLALLTSFIWYEKRTRHPMLPLALFKHHNFSVGNVATFAIYAGLSAVTFVLVLFVQQVGHYSALQSGFTLIPITLILFLLSSRMGHLAGKLGPRWFMASGPWIMAIGLSVIALSISPQIKYATQLLPGIIIFGLGLATTVAPLTSAILGDVEKERAGIASAINNAVSRIAGLLAVAAIGAILASRFAGAMHAAIADHTSNQPSTVAAAAQAKTFDITVPNNLGSDSSGFKTALETASLSAFRTGTLAVAALIALGGIISAIGIRNPSHSKPQPTKAVV